MIFLKKSFLKKKHLFFYKNSQLKKEMGGSVVPSLEDAGYKTPNVESYCTKKASKIQTSCLNACQQNVNLTDAISICDYASLNYYVMCLKNPSFKPKTIGDLLDSTKMEKQ